MAYTTTQKVQQWCQASKYTVDTIPDEFVEEAVDTCFSRLGRRYDTTPWLNEATTPSLVLNLITMLVASYVLRKAFAEDEGAHEYPDWLEGRVLTMLEGISDGLLEIPGTDPDPESAVEGVPAFFPTDDATDLWFDDPTAEGGAARAFTMEQIF